MSDSLAQHGGAAPLLSLENVRPVMAKVVLKDVETSHREAYGRVLKRVESLTGLSGKELAALIEVDQAQLSRWYSGKENAQTWRYHAIPTLRDALRLAEAFDAEGVTVRTVIEVERRRA